MAESHQSTLVLKPQECLCFNIQYFFPIEIMEFHHCDEYLKSHYVKFEPPLNFGPGVSSM